MAPLPCYTPCHAAPLAMIHPLSGELLDMTALTWLFIGVFLGVCIQVRVYQGNGCGMVLSSWTCVQVLTTLTIFAPLTKRATLAITCWMCMQVLAFLEFEVRRPANVIEVWRLASLTEAHRSLKAPCKAVQLLASLCKALQPLGSLCSPSKNLTVAEPHTPSQPPQPMY